MSIQPVQNGSFCQRVTDVLKVGAFIGGGLLIGAGLANGAVACSPLQPGRVTFTPNDHRALAMCHRVEGALDAYYGGAPSQFNITAKTAPSILEYLEEYPPTDLLSLADVKRKCHAAIKFGATFSIASPIMKEIDQLLEGVKRIAWDNTPQYVYAYARFPGMKDLEFNPLETRTQNTKNAIDYIFDKIKDRAFFYQSDKALVGVLKKVHRLACKGLKTGDNTDIFPGKFRKEDACIHPPKNLGGSHPVYWTPHPEEIPDLMFKFVRELKERYQVMKRGEGGNFIELAAWVHQEISRIHPFLDGNGRVARMVMNGILRLGEHIVPAFSDRGAYFSATAGAAQGGYLGFAKFLAENILKTQGMWQRRLLR